MLIKCPECGFSRDVPEEKLPASVSLATCPKCKSKFKFRNLPESTRQQDKPVSRPHAEPTQDTQAPQRRPEFPEPSPSVTHPQAGQTRHSPASTTGEQANQPRKAGAAPAKPLSKTTGDIWQSLESMRPKQPENTLEEERQVLPSLEQLELDPDEQSATHGQGGTPLIDVPWERMDKFGLAGGFWQTLKRAMLRPQDFFGHMPLHGLAMPLAFFLVIGCVQIAAQLFWDSAGMTFLDLFLQRPDVEQSGLSLGEGGYLLFIIYPLILTVALFAIAGLHHLFLMASQAAQRGFEATFRAVAYGSAPLVLAVIPFVGDLVGLAWNVSITIIAYRYIHRTSYTRVGLAMLIPLVALLLIGLYFRMVS
ncbi:Protein of unknown function DUF2143 [Desulfocurvibacter africanus subsp. africanus str. Walvis Bay]|uniref:MJ0042 family finger-like protein n=2 Tax=Desulfocurvibacter africanus TaxID=873 RepID=F3Z0F6_DESAF|nr:Protein of unknown function DUF2143 [Desulfocurvibacter africanus subsp. africanus str. Walvis Bay]